MKNKSDVQINDLAELKQIERKRRDVLCRAACATVAIMLVIFSVKDASTGETFVSLVTGILATFHLTAMLLYTRFKNLEAFSAYQVVTGGILCIYLVYTGGSSGSGVVWTAAFPIVMFALLNARLGRIINIFMFTCIVILLYVPIDALNNIEYEFHLKSAATGSFALIAFFTYYQAREREVAAASIAHLNVELRQIASTDDLTQLSNRRDITLRLEFECKRAQRDKTEFSVILCDIDYFKRINDSYGHGVGDQVLRSFADLLKSRFRETDQVGRWGGEEFLIILPNTPRDEAIHIANEVRVSICQASLLENMPNRMITMSAGVASSAASYEPAELVKIADKHLYEAKNGGRNLVKPDAQLKT